MRTLPNVILKCLMLLACAMPLASIAASDPSMPPQGDMGQAHFDWAKHTQVTLDELKSKLNLNPAQGSAWDAWATGVMSDAHKQLSSRTEGCRERMRDSDTWIHESTPDQMAHGIACLRAQTTWMQAHLVQLEAAQARTKTFYDTLDTNQKTIFDLFWHEMYHRVSGHHGGSFDSSE